MFNVMFLFMNQKLLLKSIGALCLTVLFTAGSVGFANATTNPPDSNGDTDETVQRTVTGTVTGEDGEGIPGVNVVVKGTTTGVITDFNGAYSLDVPSDDATLVFSSVGFVTQEIVVGNQTTIDIDLSQDVTALEEVVVIGYGTATKKDLTGAVVNVQAEQLEKYKPTSVSEILRSAVPGLQVGYAVNARNVPDFEVRGDASLKADIDNNNDDEEERAANRPLIVLDGVIFRGDLAEINPNTIESVDVLKDASAAAVFGSQATNGVVIFTTKKGQLGKPQINFSTRVGLVTGARRQRTYQGSEEVLNWLTDMNEAITSTDQDPVSRFDDYFALTDPALQAQWLSLNNLDPGTTDPTTINLARVDNFNLWEQELQNFEAGNEFDWQDFYFHTGLRQDYDVSVSGRTERVSYFFSAGYSHRESVRIDESFETITSRLNLDVNLAEFLNIGVNAQFTFQDEGQEAVGGPDANDTGGYRTKSIWDQPWTNGTERTPENLTDQAAGSNQSNPYQEPWWNNRLHQRFMVNPTIFAQFTLPFGFSLRQDFTPRFDFRRRFDFDQAGNPQRAVDLAERRIDERFEWQSNTILNWDKAFGEHRFSVTGLYNTEKNQVWQTWVNANNFSPTASLGFHGLGFGLVPLAGVRPNGTTFAQDEANTRIGIMGRINYNYSDRYNFTAAVRRDGFSRFGADNLWANFPTLAAGWTITNESFMPSSPVLSYLKLRLSWGVNGNSRGLEAYNAFARLSNGTWLNYDGGYNAVPWTNLSRFALPNLSWERTASFNVGVDFGLFNDRVNGTLDVYRSETTDLILDQRLPELTGFSTAKNNVGSLRNSGFDLGINTVNMSSANFTWTTNFNVTYAINEITSLGNAPTEQPDGSFRESDDLQNGWFIGQNKDVIWDLEVDGTWKVGQEAEAASFDAFVGDFRFIDQNGDGEIDVNDRVFQGFDYNPWYTTLRNDFEFMGFDFGLVLLGRLGWNGTTGEPFNESQSYIKNRNWYVIPYWTPTNQIDEAARINSVRPLGADIIVNRDYVRIQNVSLGYSLPASLLENINFSRVRLAVNIENVAVFTDWPEYLGDPESQREMPRTYSFSLDFSF